MLIYYHEINIGLQITNLFMKSLKCSELGGPSDCVVEITGESFEEVGSNCKNHVMELVGTGDGAHLAAVDRMKSLSPEEQQAEFASYEQKYNEAAEL